MSLAWDSISEGKVEEDTINQLHVKAYRVNLANLTTNLTRQVGSIIACQNEVWNLRLKATQKRHITNDYHWLESSYQKLMGMASVTYGLIKLLKDPI